MKQINLMGLSLSNKMNQKASFSFNRLLKKIITPALTLCFIASASAQAPALGVTGFNNPVFDQAPFAVGSAYPSVLTANNVAGTGYSFHIGAIGVYMVTQVNQGGGVYNGAISATNVTPGGGGFYQTFAFTSANLSMFRLKSVKVKIDNASPSPVVMALAGVVSGANTGSTVNFVAPPGSNWIPVDVSANPNFFNINGVISINLTGSPAVSEMAFDDIDIATAINTGTPPSITTHPSNKTVCAGVSTSFSAAASNAVAYYWLMSTDGLIWNLVNGSTPGATFTGYNSTTLSVGSPSIALNGLYLAMVAVNAAGVNTGSNPARLFINSLPTVAAISGPTSVCKGNSISLSDATGGGTWSSLNNYASVDGSGNVTGLSAGTAVIRYTVSNGGCSNYASYNVTVGSNLVVPGIAYAAGTTNPQTGAGTGFCTNRTFTLVGNPGGGTWSSSGVISVSPGGVVNTGAVPGAGSVTYTWTNASGCSNSRTINGTVVACAPRGVNASVNTKSDETVSMLYPNPAKNSVNIKADFITAGATLTITNLVGKQLKVQNLSLGNNNVDITSLPRGFYMVSIQTAEGRKTQKLIVE